MEPSNLSQGEELASDMENSSVIATTHDSKSSSNPYARQRTAPVVGVAARFTDPPNAPYRPAPVRALPPEDDDDDALIQDYLNENDFPEDLEEYEDYVPHSDPSPATKPIDETSHSRPVPERITASFREEFDSEDDEPLIAAPMLRLNRPKQDLYKFERYVVFAVLLDRSYLSRFNRVCSFLELIFTAFV
jgi:hypothetical protein